MPQPAHRLWPLNPGLNPRRIWLCLKNFLNKYYFLNEHGVMDAKEQDFLEGKPSLPKSTSGLVLDLHREGRMKEKWKLTCAKLRFSIQMALNADILEPMDLSGDQHRRN